MKSRLRGGFGFRLMGEKRFIEEKYADDLLVLAHKYINENPDKKGTGDFKSMEKTLETMDKYWAYINRMGFMMHQSSIVTMKKYIAVLLDTQCEFEHVILEEILDYLKNI